MEGLLSLSVNVQGKQPNAGLLGKSSIHDKLYTSPERYYRLEESMTNHQHKALALTVVREILSRFFIAEI